MRDTSGNGEDEAYDDYRTVVDLDWSPGKINEYGKKKGWTLVCELMSPFHDTAIAEAGEDKTAIREAYVINESFYDCVNAAPKVTQKRPIKTFSQYDEEHRTAAVRRAGATAVEE